MSPTPQTVSVAIIGGGPVGMTLANLLGCEGIDCVVLEQNAELYGMPRAIGIDDFALRELERTGLLDELTKDMVFAGPDGRRVGVTYYDGNHKPFLDMRPSRQPFGRPIISGFRQPLLEQTLLEGLDRFDCVQLHFGHEVTEIAQDDDGVTVNGQTTEGETFAYRAQYLIGCDGGRSFVRKSLNVGFEGATYTEKWLVLDGKEEDTPDRNVTDIKFWCSPRRTAMTMPTKYGNRRYEILQMPGETDEELLNDDTIRRLLSEYRDPDTFDVYRKIVYTFHARYADKWRHDRILLAGDAAHVMPPFAGQGMVNGVRDAGALGWRLPLILRGLVDPSILDSYETERRPIVKFATELAINFGRVIMPKYNIQAFLTAWTFRLLQVIPSVREYIREAKFRPPAFLPRGCILPKPDKKSRNSTMIPQPHVRTPDGDLIMLDDALGSGFAVIGYGVDPYDALSDDSRHMWESLGTTFLRIDSPGSKSTGPSPTVEDHDGVLGAWMEPEYKPLLFVRPDKFLFAESSVADADSTTQQIATLIGFRSAPSTQTLTPCAGRVSTQAASNT